jgi:plasmid stabilization system protein ParE
VIVRAYRLSEQAKTDLRGIWNYISERSLSGADRIVDGLFTHFQLLAREPLLGVARNDLHPGMRVFVFENYLIMYYPMRSGIEVAGIVHAAQDIESQFEQGKR